MPYGLPGGRDSDPKFEKWMENCVNRVMKTGKEKDIAVAICKGTLKKMNYDLGKAEFILASILDK